jgi:hypothetical protein
MIGWGVDDDENEHIANLAKLRDRLIEERRVQVAATVNGSAAGNVSEGDFLKIRELQTRIQEVKEMLEQEKGAAFSIAQKAEWEERAKKTQAQHEARRGKMGG